MPMKTTLMQLRSDPSEWLRRGLMPPDAIQAMVEERLAIPGLAQPVGDPSYSDFFLV